MRIHPAVSRVQKLATEHPAMFIVFDLLVDERGTTRSSRSLEARQASVDSKTKKPVTTGSHTATANSALSAKPAMTKSAKTGHK
jgi:ATP-dependent DNA ligase